MSTIHMQQTTTLTSAQYIAGLTDFGPGRSKLFGNSADDYMKVHSRGPSQADVTEGSSGIWERLHYDWSDPNHVVLKTTDSNTWGGASGHTYTFMRRPDGLTDIDLVTVRDGKNLKGWLVGLVVGAIGKGSSGEGVQELSQGYRSSEWNGESSWRGIGRPRIGGLTLRKSAPLGATGASQAVRLS